MMARRTKRVVVAVLFVSLMGCTHIRPALPVNSASVEPSTSVNFKGKPYHLLGIPLSVGKPLPSTILINAFTMAKTELSHDRGSVLFLSIVPSIDTRVCEAQTHYLAEQGSKLPLEVKKIVISRDTPFAQKRFAEEAMLTGLTYLSDHRLGDFGRATGLMMDDLYLLARSVVIVDREGVVRYVQVVPEITNLPDMEKAFSKAIELTAK